MSVPKGLGNFEIWNCFEFSTLLKLKRICWTLHRSHHKAHAIHTMRALIIDSSIPRQGGMYSVRVVRYRTQSCPRRATNSTFMLWFFQGVIVGVHLVTGGTSNCHCSSRCCRLGINCSDGAGPFQRQIPGNIRESRERWSEQKSHVWRGLWCHDRTAVIWGWCCRTANIEVPMSF